MFGLSLTKILLTIFVIVAVWYVYKVYQRKKKLSEEGVATPFARLFRGESLKARSASAAAAKEAEDMVACPTCGAYVSPRSAVSCGKANCPYPG
jgi:uncharacterized protein